MGAWHSQQVEGHARKGRNFTLEGAFAENEKAIQTRARAEEGLAPDRQYSASNNLRPDRKRDET